MKTTRIVFTAKDFQDAENLTAPTPIDNKSTFESRFALRQTLRDEQKEAREKKGKIAPPQEYNGDRPNNNNSNNNDVKHNRNTRQSYPPSVFQYLATPIGAFVLFFIVMYILGRW